MNHVTDLRRQLAKAFNQRDWGRAFERASQLLSIAPELADVHFAAGFASLEMRQLTTAVRHLRIAVSREPARVDFVVHLARALSTAKLSQEAKSVADSALALSPDEPEIFSVLGAVYAEAGAHRESLSAHRQAAALAPRNPSYRYNLATTLITAGEVDAAEQEIETCLAIEPTFWRAHLTLSHLRKQTIDSQHVPRLEHLLASRPADNGAQMCLHLALAKEHEDLADYPRAFDHLVQGKMAGKRGIDYAIAQDEALFRALERAFPEPLSATPTGDSSEEPIFVFGMPRTGTTLVERILCSHPDVYAAGELLNFGMMLRRAWGQRPPIWLDPDIATSTRQIDWPQVGEAYVASTRPATGQTARFVDKFPFNFLYAGFIAQALPRARLICLRRNPMDTCLGNFRQLFAEKLPYYNYSFNLLDTGRYYVLFDRLMAHWKQTFPGRILEVNYETLVDTPEASARRIIEFCGLPWNDACLRFDANPGAVSTASALQVRKPIYRDAIDFWRRYEPQLDELKTLLSSTGIKVDD